MLADRKTFFLADVHLGAEATAAERHTKEKRLYALIDSIQHRGGTLYLVGDIFDFWFEYRSVMFSNPFGLLCKLRSAADAGVELHFLGGNHDFGAGRVLESLGISVHKNHLALQLYGKRVYLAHGDGCSTRDWGYRFLLKPIIRNRVSQFLFYLLHPDLAYTLGKVVAGGSRKLTDERNESYKEHYFRFGQKKLSDGFDAVIIGHTHLARVVGQSDGFYAELGDFFHHFTFGEMDNDGFRLMRVLESGRIVRYAE